MKKPDTEYLCLIYNETKTGGKVTSKYAEATDYLSNRYAAYSEKKLEGIEFEPI